MTAHDPKPWATDIRRQVLQLIIILMSLVVIAGSYNFLSNFLIDDVRSEINGYHLLANSQYLRAQHELRNLKSDHLEGTGGSPEFAKQRLRPKSQSTQADPSILGYIITEKIELGLELERKFGDPRFSELSNTLELRLLSLSESFGADNGLPNNFQSLLNDADSLITTLEQIIRLHVIARDKGMTKLNEEKQFHNVIFHLLMTILSGIAFIVARKSFDSINQIINKQVESEERIRHQAHHDNLTQLPNRFLALDRLSQMIKQARRNNSKAAVLMIDLDFFKKVNDMLGHAGGDKLLVEAAQRITRSLRAGDTVGRLGGDEFIVLAEGISNSEEVMQIADKLVKQLSTAFVIEGKEFVLTASIGITVYPDDSVEELELIQLADTAMYYSKESGRNTYSFFTESMNSVVVRRLALEEQIHGALDRGEFEVFFQQQVDLSSNRIIGAEALLRWDNKVLGSVSPEEFIPVAEQSGLIVSLGEFVLKQALEMTGFWKEHFLPGFRIAVNLSPRQFRDPNLVNNILRTLQELGVSGRNLELEITEGVLMTEYIHIGKALADLSQQGITLAMDDFGTGYSSLSYLRNFPFDVIKLDRNFIQDIDQDPMSYKLNKAAIAMAHALNICVVAEGIETHKQFEMLKNLNCDVGQGYYFGRPMGARQMTELLQAQDKKQQAVAIVDFSRNASIVD